MQSHRIERFGPLHLVGLMRSHKSAQDNPGLFRILSTQWKDYFARRTEPAAVIPTYGVFGCMADGATHFDYFCGAPTEHPLPTGFVVMDLPAMRCAVFDYSDHISGLRDFVGEIFRHRLPAAGLSLLPTGSGTPEFIERYGDAFDVSTLQGGMEVLIPVQD